MQRCAAHRGPLAPLAAPAACESPSRRAVSWAAERSRLPAAAVASHLRPSRDHARGRGRPRGRHHPCRRSRGHPAWRCQSLRAQRSPRQAQRRVLAAARRALCGSEDDAPWRSRESAVGRAQGWVGRQTRAGAPALRSEGPSPRPDMVSEALSATGRGSWQQEKTAERKKKAFAKTLNAVEITVVLVSTQVWGYAKVWGLGRFWLRLGPA